MKIKVPKLCRPVILLIIIKIIASCAPDTCIQETTSFLNAGFYKTGTNTPLPPDSVTVFGIGNETNILYGKALNPTSVSLPLNASSTTCGFVMKINNMTDTLKFIYTSYPHLISKECGITFFFSLDSVMVSGNVIDTVAVINKNIAIFNAENIRIFY
jgi:Family of unknown function (DUF6452)